MKRNNSRKGFTIIEVALVLAIAGLIFLMVFIALPAVQRTQRDAKRRDDVGRLLTALSKFSTNNRGALPSGNASGLDWNTAKNADTGATDWAGFYKSFLGESFEDPKGHYYKISAGDCNAKVDDGVCSYGSEANNDSISFDNYGYVMYVVRRATCDGSSPIPSSNPKNVAVVYKMEGTGAAYCANTN